MLPCFLGSYWFLKVAKSNSYTVNIQYIYNIDFMKYLYENLWRKNWFLKIAQIGKSEMMAGYATENHRKYPERSGLSNYDGIPDNSFYPIEILISFSIYIRTTLRSRNN